MRFGVCGPVEKTIAMQPQGWDHLEGNAQKLCQGLTADAEWTGESMASEAKLPIKSTNGLVPGELKIVGPAADPGKLRDYARNVISRAAKLGIEVMVFGSGGSRRVPDDFPREKAVEQITDFLKIMAPIAEEHSVTIVIEALNSKECNIITTIEEAMTYVKELDHPRIQCLLDTYHMWMENEPVENLQAAAPWIRHVHVADNTTRLAPGMSGSDYRPLFAILKQAGYTGMCSIEARDFDVAVDGEKTLAFLKQQWNEA